jgi:hypothetical protein
VAEDLEGGDEGGDGVGEFGGVEPIGLQFSWREREMDCARVGVVGTPKRKTCCLRLGGRGLCSWCCL